jgi:hypothetical protein
VSGLYVALDVEYDSDDKMILAGPMAELLYVRGLAFCKRTMSNGNISRAQLAVVGRGIPSASKHAAALVEVGAWVITPQGWRVAAWLKRNKSAEQIAADRATRKAASVQANHDRWHTGPDGKPSVSCPICRPNPDPTSDPTSDPKPKPEPKGSHSHSHKPEGRDTIPPPPPSISRGAGRGAAEEERGGEIISISDALRGGAA